MRTVLAVGGLAVPQPWQETYQPRSNGVKHADNRRNRPRSALAAAFPPPVMLRRPFKRPAVADTRPAGHVAWSPT